jgi:hypothetical protein
MGHEVVCQQVLTIDNGFQEKRRCLDVALG